MLVINKERQFCKDYKLFELNNLCIFGITDNYIADNFEDKSKIKRKQSGVVKYKLAQYSTTQFAKQVYELLVYHRDKDDGDNLDAFIMPLEDWEIKEREEKNKKG